MSYYKSRIDAYISKNFYHQTIYPLSNLQVFFVKPLFFSTFSLLYSLKKHNSIKRKKKKSVMGNHQFIYPIFISFITTLGLVSISLCIAAEFKKTKVSFFIFSVKSAYILSSHTLFFGIISNMLLLIHFFFLNWIFLVWLKFFFFNL